MAIIAGGNEFEAGVWQVKNLQKKESADVSGEELAEHLQSLLG